MPLLVLTDAWKSHSRLYMAEKHQPLHNVLDWKNVLYWNNVHDSLETVSKGQGTESVRKSHHRQWRCEVDWFARWRGFLFSLAFTRHFRDVAFPYLKNPAITLKTMRIAEIRVIGLRVNLLCTPIRQEKRLSIWKLAITLNKAVFIAVMALCLYKSRRIPHLLYPQEEFSSLWQNPNYISIPRFFAWIFGIKEFYCHKSQQI